MTKTLEEWKRSQYFPDRPSLMKAIDLTAAEILRVAEEWCEAETSMEGYTRGQDKDAYDLYSFLKSYINSTNTEGGE